MVISSFPIEKIQDENAVRSTPVSQPFVAKFLVPPMHALGNLVKKGVLNSGHTPSISYFYFITAY